MFHQALYRLIIVRDLISDIKEHEEKKTEDPNHCQTKSIPEKMKGKHHTPVYSTESKFCAYCSNLASNRENPCSTKIYRTRWYCSCCGLHFFLIPDRNCYSKYHAAHLNK